MHVVGARELEPPAQRAAEAEPLEDGRRNRQSEQREPDDCRQNERAVEEQARDEDDVSHRQRDRHPPPRRPLTGDERDPAEERARHQERSDRQHEGKRRPAPDQGRADGERGRSEAERERGPETAAVEADCFRNELSHRPRLGRKRRR